MSKSNFSKSVSRLDLFDKDMLNFCLPEICGISELQTMPSNFNSTGLDHIFTVYLTHSFSFEVGYPSEQEARVARKDLINGLAAYMGPDQLIFANGFDFEVAVIRAVTDITDVFCKDGRASFSVSIESMPYSLNMVFMDELTATAHHRCLVGMVESQRCESCVVLAVACG